MEGDFSIKRYFVYKYSGHQVEGSLRVFVSTHLCRLEMFGLRAWVAVKQKDKLEEGS